MTGRRDGFVVVAVLSVLALLTSLLGSLALLTRTTIDGALTGAERLKLDALAQAGIELAGYQLYGLKLPAVRLSGQEVRLDDGTVSLGVEDESARIDLNGSDPALLAGLYRAAGSRALEPEAFAALVVRWRERPAPPEAARASGEPEGGGPRQEGFRSVAELGWLPGLSAADRAALEPLVTVHNPAGRIDPLAAPEPVLLALPGMTPMLLDRLRALRTNPFGKTGADAARLLERQSAFLAASPSGNVRVRAEARTASGSKGSIRAILIRAPARQAGYFVTEWGP